MARPKIVVAENTRRSIVSKYGKGDGLVALAAEFEVSLPVIRRVLVDSGSEIRGRGRPVTVTA